MNLELLESYGQNYPEEHDGNLDSSSVALTCAFNRRGTLLAVGCNDGRIYVWDFLTRGIAKTISAHAHTVASLGWNRRGCKIVSASTDNQVCVWNVLNGECEISFRFPGAIIQVQFNPRNEQNILVCPLKAAPLVVGLDGKRYNLPCVEDGDINICASYDRRGRCIYAGNSKGKIFVICAKEFKLLMAFKVGTSTQGVKQIKFARKGSCFLVNSVDRVIRVYDSDAIVGPDTKIPEGKAPLVSTIEPIQKLQDLVNRTLWKSCTFSGDGEYICAGSAKQHQIYIWEKNQSQQMAISAQLVKILEGTRGEQLLDIVWHPVRPIICSVSSGVISIWAQNQVENWSAFAPDFTELDENVEYNERESEFDEEDEDKSIPPKEDEIYQDIEVDVEKVDRIEALCSSDEGDEDGDCLFLTITPEVDDPEENPHHPPKDVTEMKEEISSEINSFEEKSVSKATKRKKSLKSGRPQKPKKLK